MKENNKKLVWVHPGFGNLLKSIAAERGESVLDLTKKISENPTPLERLADDIKERRKKYDFF